jgi:hypothetical protein
LDIFSSIKNLEESDLQIAIAIPVLEKGNILLRLNERNDLGDISVLDPLNIHGDVFEVHGALVTDLVELFSEVVISGTSQLNKFFLILSIKLVFVDLSESGV